MINHGEAHENVKLTFNTECESCVVETPRYRPYVRYTSNESDVGRYSDLAGSSLDSISNGRNTRLDPSFTSGDTNFTRSPGSNVDSVSFGVQVRI